MLGRYLAGQVERGMLRLDDQEQAARYFMGMMLGTLHMECLLGCGMPRRLQRSKPMSAAWSGNSSTAAVMINPVSETAPVFDHRNLSNCPGGASPVIATQQFKL